MAEPRALRIVVPRYGPEVLGGSEALMRRLATRLAGRGWTVDVLTSCARSERTWRNVERPGSSLDEGVRVHRFPTVMARSPAAFALATRAFFRCPHRLRAERPWITAQGPWMPALLRALGRAPAPPTVLVPYLYHPTLYGIHAVAGVRILQPAAHEERPLHLRAVGRAVAAADAVWYGTPEERDLMERVHPIAAERTSEVGTTAVEAPAGIDPRAFAASNRLPGPYLLYAGRATAGKGLEVPLAALEVLRRSRPDVSLVVAGDERLAGRPAGGVVGVGRLPGHRLWEAIAGAIAIVVPSPMESLSLVTLEAWAAGRPALVNAANPVLRGHAARTRGALAYDDAGGLAAMALRLVEEPGEAAARGSEGRAHLEAVYRWDLVEERLERLLAAPPRGRRRHAMLGPGAGMTPTTRGDRP